MGLSEEQISQICEGYWKKLEGAASCGLYNFIGHPDLPKKFGFVDNDRYLPHACRVLDALACGRGAIELNTAGWFKECNAPYPSGAILKEAALRHIPVIVNADAHHQDHIKRNFAEAAQLLSENGIRLN